MWFNGIDLYLSKLISSGQPHLCVCVVFVRIRMEQENHVASAASLSSEISRLNAKVKDLEQQ